MSIPPLPPGEMEPETGGDLTPISAADRPPYLTQPVMLTSSASSPSSSSSPTNSICEWCDGAGFYAHKVRYGHPDFGKLFACHCTQQQRRARADALALTRLGDELGALSDRTFATFRLDRPLGTLLTADGVYYPDLSRVPFVPGTSERIKTNAMSEKAQRAALIKALRIAEEYARTWQGWLVLHGAYGAGKSHLAAAIAHAAVEQGYATRYRSMPGLFDALKKGFDDGTSDAIFEDLIRCDVLILDDLLDADIRASDWRRSRLFRLLNEREGRPLIITSNRRMEDLAPANDVDAGRLLSRIAGDATQVWLPISDYRRLKERAA